MNTERIIVGSLSTNCYIIYDNLTKEGAVIDPGGSADLISSKIKNNELNVKYIILTHAHVDHIGALDTIVAETNAKVCASQSDSSALNDNYTNLCMHFGSSSPTKTSDIILNDGDTLKLGEQIIRIIATPGHTIGSISLLYDNTLISGDTLFFESVGRTDFPSGNMAELMNSIKTKLFALSPDTVVLPGHGESTTIGHEIKNNPFIW